MGPARARTSKGLVLSSFEQWWSIRRLVRPKSTGRTDAGTNGALVTDLTGRLGDTIREIDRIATAWLKLGAKRKLRVIGRELVARIQQAEAVLDDTELRIGPTAAGQSHQPACAIRPQPACAVTRAPPQGLEGEHPREGPGSSCERGSAPQPHQKDRSSAPHRRSSRSTTRCLGRVLSG